MDAGYTHWVLFYPGNYYDPEFGLIQGDYPHGKITSFLGIGASSGDEIEFDGNFQK